MNDVEAGDMRRESMRRARTDPQIDEIREQQRIDALLERYHRDRRRADIAQAVVIWGGVAAMVGILAWVVLR